MQDQRACALIAHCGAGRVFRNRVLGYYLGYLQNLGSKVPHRCGVVVEQRQPLLWVKAEHLHGRHRLRRGDLGRHVDNTRVNFHLLKSWPRTAGARQVHAEVLSGCGWRSCR